MKTLILLFVSLFSLSVHADYACSLRLYRIENVDEMIAQKRLHVKQGEMKSGSFGHFYLEKEKKRKKIFLSVNASMSGWFGEEDVTLAIIRNTEKGKSTEEETVSERFSLKGNDEFVGWFDVYKLVMSCEILEQEERAPLEAPIL